MDPDQATDHIDAATVTRELPIPIDTLRKEIEQACITGTEWHDRRDHSDRVRFAIWEGQDRSGRKLAKNLNTQPFPWEGASDARIRLADEVTNEQAKILAQAFARAKIQTAAREADDLARSATTTILLDYCTRTLMADHIRQEVKFLADYRQHYGCGVLCVNWERRVEAEPKTITLDAITQMAIEAGLDRLGQEVEAAAADDIEPDPVELEEAAAEIQAASIDEVQTLFLDPARESEGIAAIMQITGLPEKSAKRVLRDLRKDGAADYHVPYISVNRPRWTARIPFVDVFFPVDTSTIQDARWIAEVEWVSETELRSRALAEGWDSAWVHEVISKGLGKSHPWLTTGGNDRTTTTRLTTQGYHTSEEELHKFEVQIIHSHYRAMGPDNLPAMFRTIWHPMVEDKVAVHEMLPYRHGQIPAILTRRECVLRSAMESRGVSDIIATHQGEIKVQRDARTDRTSLATLPPTIVPAGRAGNRMLIGPGAQIPERRANELKFMEPPRHDMGSIEMENATRQDVDRYFGRLGQSVQPPVAVLHQQDMVDDFLTDLNLALVQTLQLMQQFMDPELTIRVAGTDAILPVTRDEIQGRYDVTASFDVRDLDPEYMSKKITMVGTMVLPMDSSGRIDRGALAEWAINAIDPILAKRVVVSAETANAKETEEEKAALAMMAAGVEPIMPENSGMNHPLRMQTLQAAIQANPALQQRLAEDQMFSAMVQARVKFHNQAIMQEQNKTIGRIGSAPVTRI